MKQKEEIANQQETILMQIDKVNENRLELAKQSWYERANEEIIQSQEEKIKQQDTEFGKWTHVNKFGNFGSFYNLIELLSFNLSEKKPFCIEICFLCR